MKYFAKTDIGKKREKNEDFFYTGEIFFGKVKADIFVVADGMGGHKKGEIASKMAIENLVEHLQKADCDITYDDNVTRLIEDAFKEANKKIYDKAQNGDKYFGMGTTMLLAMILENKMYVANVGDSRLYLQSENNFIQVTKDNSYVQELLERGIISKSEAIHHKEKNRITRAVGSECDVKVDFYIREIENGNKILLCTDGLTNMVSDEDIYKILNDENLEMPDISEKLIQVANTNGGNDNSTVITVFI